MLPQALSAFALPAALLSQGFALRPETDADIPFLIALYASTREEELASVPWSAEQKQRSWRANSTQHSYYRATPTAHLT